MEDDPDDPKAETFKRHETSKAGAPEKEVRAPRQKSILGFLSRAPKKCQQAVETLESKKDDAQICSQCGDKIPGNKGALSMHMFWKHSTTKEYRDKTKNEERRNPFERAAMRGIISTGDPPTCEGVNAKMGQNEEQV